MIMDTSQGWYKDGTEGKWDYRSISALFMLLRIALVAEFLIVIQLFLQSKGGKKVGSDWSCARVAGDFPSHYQTL